MKQQRTNTRQQRPHITAMFSFDTEEIASILQEQGIEPSNGNIKKVTGILYEQAAGFIQTILACEDWSDWLDQ